MILANSSSVKTEYKIIQSGSAKEWNGTLSAGCQKVLVLPTGYTYTIIFNTLGQQVSSAKNLTPCATVSFTILNGTVSVSVNSTNTLLKNDTRILKSTLCEIKNYPQIHQSIENINTLPINLSITQLSASLLLTGIKILKVL